PFSMGGDRTADCPCRGCCRGGGSMIYTPPTLADRWHCKADAVRELLASGKLKGFRVGRSHWRITLAEVERYERGETSAPAVETPRQRRRQTRREIPAGPF